MGLQFAIHFRARHMDDASPLLKRSCNRSFHCLSIGNSKKRKKSVERESMEATRGLLAAKEYRIYCSAISGDYLPKREETLVSAHIFGRDNLFPHCFQVAPRW